MEVSSQNALHKQNMLIINDYTEINRRITKGISHLKENGTTIFTFYNSKRAPHKGALVMELIL